MQKVNMHWYGNYAYAKLSVYREFMTPKEDLQSGCRRNRSIFRSIYINARHKHTKIKDVVAPASSFYLIPK